MLFLQGTAGFSLSALQAFKVQTADRRNPPKLSLRDRHRTKSHPQATQQA